VLFRHHWGITHYMGINQDGGSLMTIFDEEFFSMIFEKSVGVFNLRCIVCRGEFEADYESGKNVYYSIRCRRIVPQCPCCGTAPDSFDDDESCA
jgi:hypothetical protein